MLTTLTMCQPRPPSHYNGDMTQINVEDAIGPRLAHDITSPRFTPASSRAPLSGGATTFGSRMCADACGWVSSFYRETVIDAMD